MKRRERGDVVRTVSIALIAVISLIAPVMAIALTSTTLGLTASPNPSTLGQAVTLTATVSPSAATGKVTFYDGTTVLGISTLSNGQATLITKLLPSGSRSLKAYYSGDASYAASTSTAVPQTVNTLPQNGFQPIYSGVPGNYYPHFVAVGDFNGDGKPDLAVTSFLASNMSILLGNGNGSFQLPVTYPVGTCPGSIAVGDFNGDGKADLAVANYCDSAPGIAVLLGNGDGTFQPAAFSNVGSNLSSLLVGDFNGDGKPDLGVANSNTNNISILLGNGDGTFQPAVNYSTGAGPTGLAAGDFNGDARADLVATNYYDNSISVLLGNGDGSFQAAVSYGVGTYPRSVAVADFNGDGQADLAVVDYGNDKVSVLLGNGDGTFQAAVNYSVPLYSHPLAVAVWDFNGDGKSDLAVVNNNSNNVNLLLGNGDGTFVAAVNLPVGMRPVFVAVGDFNSDGVSDLAVPNYSNNNVSVLSVLLGTGTTAPPDLSITKTHTGNFTLGQIGASYKVTVSNLVGVPTTGTVSVTDTLPAGLTATAISGTGWSCTLGTLTCTRSDSLGAGLSYAAIIVTVNVAANAAASVINTATVSGGGDVTPANDTASDTTAIFVPDTLVLAASPNPSTLGQAVTLTATVSPSTATGNVTFYDGTSVLGTRSLSGGQATLVTTLLPNGSRSLKAYYAGDTTFAPSSGMVLQTVVALPQNGFQATINYNAGVSPYGVAVGDFDGDGKADYAIANTGSNTVSVRLGNGDGTFQAADDYPVGSGPTVVAVGDFDGDGWADLVVVNYNGGTSPGNTISVLLGNGDGTLQEPVTYDTGYGVSSVAVGDFNGDGKPDLVLAGGYVQVMLGNGDGSFQAPVIYDTGYGASFVVLGEFNGDGKADLAVIGINGIAVLLSNADGGFRSAVNYPAGVNPVFVATGDLNGDGKTDLAVANAGSNDVSVLLGNGDGTFQAAVTYGVGATPHDIAVGDFNGDGKADLAVANQGGNNVSVLLGSGDGTFQTAVSYSVGTNPYSVAVADFNGDGVSDLVVTNSSTNNISILRGIGTTAPPDLSVAKAHAGSFTQGQSGASYKLTISNLTGVSSTGMVTVSDTLPAGLTATAISGTGWSCTLGTLTCTRSDSLGAGLSYAAIIVTVNVAANAAASVINTATVSGGGDVTPANDTASDTTAIFMPDTVVLAASPNPSTLGQAVTLTATVSPVTATGKVTFYDGVAVIGTSPLSSGQATLVTRLLPTGNRSLRAYYLGDSSFAPNSSGTVAQTVVALSQNGFLTAVNYNPGTFPHAVAVGDFNADGKADLAVANTNSNNVSVLLGNGDGTFQAAVNYNLGSGPTSIAVGDFNADGKVDLVIVNNGANNASVLVGNGDGTFQTPVNYSVANGPVAVAVSDFNGDGKADLAIANYNSNNVSVLLGNGDSSFQAAINFSAGPAHANFVAVGDFNGDGKADLAVANYEGSGSTAGLSVLLGNGDGTFQAAVNYYAGGPAYSVAVGDFNGDGRADLAVADEVSNVSVLLGKGDGTFQPGVGYHAGCNLSAVVVGDFNGDGKPDIAVGDKNCYPAVDVFLGSGNGTFQGVVRYFASLGPLSLAVGDFNGDGVSDLAAPNSSTNNVSILLGKRLGPPLNLSNIALNFGSQTVGVSSAGQTITVNNGGTASANLNLSVSGDFAKTTTCGATLAAGASCTATITFTATQAGLRAGALGIEGGLNSPQQVRLFGVGISGAVGPKVSLSSLLVSFSAAGSQPVTLTNIGDTVLMVNSVSASGDFTQTNNCGSVVPAGSCTINVTFTPGGAGIRSGLITIVDTAPGSPHVIRLSGMGSAVTGPAVSLSSVSVNFGNQAGGTTSGAKTVTITNTGNTTLNISGVSTSGDFAASGCITALTPGSSCTLSISFSPTATGVRQGRVTLIDNAAGSPHVIRLFGNGT